MDEIKNARAKKESLEALAKVRAMGMPVSKGRAEFFFAVQQVMLRSEVDAAEQVDTLFGMSLGAYCGWGWSDDEIVDVVRRVLPFYRSVLE